VLVPLAVPVPVAYVFASKPKVPAAVIFTNGVPEDQESPAMEVRAEEAVWYGAVLQFKRVPEEVYVQTSPFT